MPTEHNMAVGEWHGWRAFCSCGLDERCETKEEAIHIAKQHAHYWRNDGFNITADEKETVDQVVSGY